MLLDELYEIAVALLKKLIAIPSFSREESKTADALMEFFQRYGISANRHLNNVWATNLHFDPKKTSILINSHHDTVKPNTGYTRDPFEPSVEEGKLFGLGSNDAGGALVSLIATFLYYFERPDLPFNLVFVASAEEEITGKQGIEAVLPFIPSVSSAIVGEPTLTQLAVAEKGLMVLDCCAKGKSGHAAREEGENAIYLAMKDIEWFKNFSFPKISTSLGPVKMTVTVVRTENAAHNIVPDECRFVVDIRVTDAYTHEEILEVIKQHVSCEVVPRSMRLRSSGIAADHPLVVAGLALGKTTYGSPTTSDQALIPVPSLKCGPGNSARSHTADEYIYLHEIREGIEAYVGLLEGVEK